MMKKFEFQFVITGACLVMVLFASAVNATDIISAENPDAILNIAKGFGSARLTKDSGGVPLISGRIDGTKYAIYFFGCDSNGKKCDDIQFGTAWAGTKVLIKTINEWNRTKRYGVAYLDKDGDPNLDMPVNIDYGVTAENLESTFNFWTIILKQFKKEVLKK